MNKPTYQQKKDLEAFILENDAFPKYQSNGRKVEYYVTAIDNIYDSKDGSYRYSNFQVTNSDENIFLLTQRNGVFHMDCVCTHDFLIPLFKLTGEKLFVGEKEYGYPMQNILMATCILACLWCMPWWITIFPIFAAFKTVDGRRLENGL